MGQSASSQASSAPATAPSPPSRRSSIFWRRSPVLPSESTQTARSLPLSRARDAQSRRQSSGDRFANLLHQVWAPQQSSSGRGGSSVSTRIRRPRRHSANLLSGTSDATGVSRERSLQSLLEDNIRNVASSRARPEISPPRADVPATQLDRDLSSLSSSTPSRPAGQRSSLRLPNSLSDRLSGFRQNRSISTTTTTNTVLRRRRASPLQSTEDNAALLSRLLSVAASTTAQTLLEGTHHSMAEASGTPMDGEDGTWDSFLRSLESGPLSVALREGSSSDPSSSLNLFRLFRFEPRPTMTANAGQQRMVPISIVGIRSVVPGSVTENNDDNVVPTFLEALTTTPINTRGMLPRQDSRRSVTGQRRRASMGGVGQISNGFESQRHERNLNRLRPQSFAAEPASWPRPPPTTPATPGSFASPDRSFANSRAVSPSRTPEEVAPEFDDSVISTTTTTTLETTTERTQETPASPRPRQVGESEHRHSTRRHGVVEPDRPAQEQTRSWIIYVLGGSYPENHPLLHTPSLFTDSPTYEDMMLLQTLVAPAKPPVASDKEVASAGGIYDIRAAVNDLGKAILVAVQKDGEERIELTPEQRCLVCLCDLEKDEEARKLADCGHVFHRECIDEWLTKGRNSCPLCRTQGVKKHEKSEAPVDSAAPTPIIPSDAQVPTIA